MDQSTGSCRIKRYLTLAEIVGQEEVTEEQAEENKQRGKRSTRPRKAIERRLPIGETTWENGVRAGIFPQPKWIGRIRAWEEEDIEALADRISAGDPSLRVDPDLVHAQLAKARSARRVERKSAAETPRANLAAAPTRKVQPAKEGTAI